MGAFIVAVWLGPRRIRKWPHQSLGRSRRLNSTVFGKIGSGTDKLPFWLGDGQWSPSSIVVTDGIFLTIQKDRDRLGPACSHGVSDQKPEAAYENCLLTSSSSCRIRRALGQPCGSAYTSRHNITVIYMPLPAAFACESPIHPVVLSAAANMPTEISTSTPSSGFLLPSASDLAVTVFLAGPTDNKAWRGDFTKLLTKAYANLSPASTPVPTPPPQHVTVIDPNNDQWDSSWSQDYHDTSDTRFRQQVDWELSCQEACDMVVFWFAAGGPQAHAPVSLLELGLALGRSRSEDPRAAKPAAVLVGCQPGYSKRGNVQAVCARNGTDVCESLEVLVSAVVRASLQVDKH